MTIASPIAGVFHWELFRATCPRSAPHRPSSGRTSGPSHTSGSIVAINPSLVAVIRFAARPDPSSATTEASSGLKWAGTYMSVIIALDLARRARRSPAVRRTDGPIQPGIAGYHRMHGPGRPE